MMYQTLGISEEAANKAPIFSVDELRKSKLEKFQGHKTSRRTLVVCSMILIATTGLLAAGIFFARPRFLPKLGIFTRSDLENKSSDISKHSKHNRKRRDVIIPKIRSKNKFKVEVYNNAKQYPINDSRLPFDLIPEEYYLQLHIDLEQDIFIGYVKIMLSCERKTNKIILHGRHLDLNNVTIILEKEIVHYVKVIYIKKFEFLIIQLEGDLEEGKMYEIHVNYTSSYGKSLAGFYRSNYTTNGQQRSMVSTHFEPTDARSAFPCLDEPFFKAKFHVSIIHDKSLTALSNMPIKKSSKYDEKNVLDEFDVSVQMSTYLVAFSVNDFKYKEKETLSGIKVRVYARPDDYDKIDYSVNAGAKIISFYEKFFNVTYPLPKLDLLAVPDFMAGAMEDWGLVSFRSAYLIFDETKMTVETMRQITLVIAHELAHQWFGNLVTMKWWNDIWLNEGFANFVEMYGTNEVNPQFSALDMQVPTGWQAAISLDSLKNSHPVSQDVSRNSEIDELFDAISYNKGASLLRMVQGFMKEKFIEGVKTYLDEYQYANAETNDLWKHLSKAIDNKLNVKEIMDTWTKQRSFPVVTLKRQNTSNFIATQESFLRMKGKLDKKNGSNLENNSLWQIPFTYMTDENIEPTTVFLKSQETNLTIDSSIIWIKANIHSMGFYVVNYDELTWKALARQLVENHKVFTDVDRAGLLHDVLKLVCEEIIDPVIALEMTKYLRKERDFIPWAMMRARSECIGMMLKEKNDKLKYKKYIWKQQSHLVNPSMLDFGDDAILKNLTIFERLQRFEAFSFVLKHNFRKDLKKKVNEIFEAMIEGVTLKGLTPENRALALMYGYNSTSNTHWNYLWQLYTMSSVDSDRKIIMRAFAQFKEKEKVDQILKKSLDRKTMRVQDTIPMLANIVKIGSRKQVWEFFVKHYEDFKARYGGGYQLGQLVNEVAGGFNTAQELKEVKTFLKTHPIGAKGSRTELQVIEKIKNNIHRHSEGEGKRKTIKKIKDWLEQAEKRDKV